MVVAANRSHSPLPYAEPCFSSKDVGKIEERAETHDPKARLKPFPAPVGGGGCREIEGCRGEGDGGRLEVFRLQPLESETSYHTCPSPAGFLNTACQDRTKGAVDRPPLETEPKTGAVGRDYENEVHRLQARLACVNQELTVLGECEKLGAEHRTSLSTRRPKPGSQLTSTGGASVEGMTRLMDRSRSPLMLEETLCVDEEKEKEEAELEEVTYYLQMLESEEEGEGDVEAKDAVQRLRMMIDAQGNRSQCSPRKACS